MRGYQRRPCHSSPAPGGSDRYSLSITAGPFCIRKAILIHEPINTDTSGFASATPPPPFGYLFSLFFSFFLFLFVQSLRENSSKVLVLIRGSALCQAWWQKQWRVSGEAVRQPPTPGSYHCVLHQWLPIRRLSGHPALALCLWDNQRTCLLRPEGALFSVD